METNRPTLFCHSAGTLDDVRDYAYHLYAQSGRIPDRDGGNWLEAEACLRANIPKDSSDQRLHHHLIRSPIRETTLPVDPTWFAHRDS